MNCLQILVKPLANAVLLRYPLNTTSVWVLWAAGVLDMTEWFEIEAAKTLYRHAYSVTLTSRCS